MDDGPRRLYHRKEKQLHVLWCLPQASSRPRRRGPWCGSYRDRPQCGRHRRDGAHEQYVSPQLSEDRVEKPHIGGQSCVATSRASADVLRSVHREKTRYAGPSRSSTRMKRRSLCMRLSPSVFPSSRDGLQVRVFQEARLLLYRVHLLAGCVSRTRTRVPEGS